MTILAVLQTLLSGIITNLQTLLSGIITNLQTFWKLGCKSLPLLHSVVLLHGGEESLLEENVEKQEERKFTALLSPLTTDLSQVITLASLSQVITLATNTQVITRHSISKVLTRQKLAKG